MPPVTIRFATDIDATFVEKILHIAKRQQETDVQHHSQADDLRTGLEVAEWRVLGHHQRLCKRPTRLKSVSSDKAHL